MWLAQKYPEHFIETVYKKDFNTDDYRPVLGDNGKAYTVKCRCNERQYNEMFRIAK